jgi:hypothetical protein
MLKGKEVTSDSKLEPAPEWVMNANVVSLKIVAWSVEHALALMVKGEGLRVKCHGQDI